MTDSRPMAQSSAAGVSVIVCCHNSASRLPDTLKHLARQVVSASLPWEVVIVDNASTDGTASLAGRVWAAAGAPAPLQVVHEPEAGLSHARQRGIAAARHELLVFVDDDNWLDRDYLTTASDIMSQHAEIGVLGGNIAAAFERPPPRWFDRLQSWFAVGPQGKASGDVTDHKLHMAGAGMVLRRSVFDDLRARGFRFLLTDRVAGALTSGGDTELCLALVLVGYRMWYDQRLRLVHFMPRTRLTRSYLFRLIRGIEASSPMVACYEAAIRRDGRSPMRLYLEVLGRRLAWTSKSLAKLILGRSTLTTCAAEAVALWRNLLMYPEWAATFAEHYADLLSLSSGRASPARIRPHSDPLHP